MCIGAAIQEHDDDKSARFLSFGCWAVISLLAGCSDDSAAPSGNTAEPQVQKCDCNTGGYCTAVAGDITYAFSKSHVMVFKNE